MTGKSTIINNNKKKKKKAYRREKYPACNACGNFIRHSNNKKPSLSGEGWRHVKCPQSISKKNQLAIYSGSAFRLQKPSEWKIL